MIECIALFFAVSLICFFTYFMNDGDLLSPSCIACFAFLACTAAAIYDCWAWGASIGLTTMLTVCVGLIFFVAPATLAYRKNKGKSTQATACNRNWNLHIDIPKGVTFSVCVFGLLISMLYIRAIIASVGMRSSWSETMQAYRWHTSFDDNFNSGISAPLNYGFRLFMSIGYVYIFAFINELLVSKTRRWLYLAPPALYCAASLGQSSRGQIIVMVFAGILMYWILRGCVNDKGQRVKFSKLLLGFMIIVAGLAIFIAGADVVGRVTVKSPFDSLMTYVGGSIIGLDQFIAKPELSTSPNHLFGSETFQGIWLFLGKTLGVPEWCYTFQLEYRFVNNVNIGNLYTAFRYYLHDFGPIGMCVISALQGWLFGSLYSSLRNRNSKLSMTQRIVMLIVFSWIGISVAYLPIADFLFHQYLNPTSFLTVILMSISTLGILRVSRKRDSVASLSVVEYLNIKE